MRASDGSKHGICETETETESESESESEKERQRVNMTKKAQEDKQKKCSERQTKTYRLPDRRNDSQIVTYLSVCLCVDLPFQIM